MGIRNWHSITIVSFAITSIFHQPMPMLERLPFMMIELSVFAVVAGAFSKLIFKNQWMILVALIAAQIVGRCSDFICCNDFNSKENHKRK